MMASLPVALQARGPKWEDPLEAYKQTASLADLLQQRRYRALQEESIRQKLEDERRERQELVNFQTGLGKLGERPSLRQLTELSPTYGPKYYEQQRLAESAAEVQKKNAAEYANLQKKIWVYKTKATLLEPDPQKKQEIFRTFSDELVKYNMLTPEQAARPLDEKTLEQLYEQIDPGEYSKLKDEQKKRTSEYEKTQLEVGEKQINNFQHFARYVTDQAGYDKLLELPLPAQFRAILPPKYEPAALQQALMSPAERATAERAGLPGAGDRFFASDYWPKYQQAHRLDKPTAADWIKAYGEFQATQTPQQMSVGMTPGAEQQRIRIEQAGITARAAAAADKPQNQAVRRSKELSLQNLNDAVSAYQKELETTGPTFQPQKGAKLQALYTNLQMLTKSLFELGVITGPDMQILQGAITDPTGIRGNYMGTKALLEQLGVMKSVIKRSKANLEEVYGTGDDATHEYDPATGKLKEIRR